jgi:arylsulfatase A-like enzyme
MDSQGIDNISCYGYSKKKTTPNIDSLAKEGTLFLNSFTPCVWTPPSHLSLFTGRYLSGHQQCLLGLSNVIIPENIPTMAEILGKKGYSTVAFTRAIPVSTTLGGFKKVFYTDVLQKKDIETEKSLFRDIGEIEGHDKGSLFSINLLKKWLLKEKERKPFFIFINIAEPHTYYWAGEPFRSRFLLKGITEKRAKTISQLNYYSQWKKKYPWSTQMEFGYPKNPEDWLIMKTLYDGETSQADHRLGLLIKHLKEIGLYENTLLIVTSDHHDVL